MFRKFTVEGKTKAPGSPMQPMRQKSWVQKVRSKQLLNIHYENLKFKMCCERYLQLNYGKNKKNVQRFWFSLGMCTLGQESAVPIHVQTQIVDVISTSPKLVLKVDKKN